MKSYPQMQMDLESGLETYAGDMPKLMEAFTGVLDEATAPRGWRRAKRDCRSAECGCSHGQRPGPRLFRRRDVGL